MRGRRTGCLYIAASMTVMIALNVAAQESSGSVVSTPASAAIPVSAAASVSESRKAAKAADRRLRKQVASVLARTKLLDSSRLLIFARAGVVTLYGEVADSEQAMLAVSAAQRVPGVSEVRTQLRISPQTK